MVNYLSKPNRLKILWHFHDDPLIDCAIDFFSGTETKSVFGHMGLVDGIGDSILDMDDD